MRSLTRTFIRPCLRFSVLRPVQHHAAFHTTPPVWSLPPPKEPSSSSPAPSEPTPVPESPSLSDAKDYSISKIVKKANKKFSKSAPKRWGVELNPDRAIRLSNALQEANFPCPSEADLTARGALLPPGYHMVYFEQPLSRQSKMKDGTDVRHHPGYPFNRRMWMGGSVTFHDRTAREGQRLPLKFLSPEQRSSVSDENKSFTTKNSREEKKPSPKEKVPMVLGTELISGCEARSSDKIVVNLARNYRAPVAFEGGTEPIYGPDSITEERKLVFLPVLPEKERAASDAEDVDENNKKEEIKKPRIIQVPKGWGPPEFAFPLIPTRRLLKEFSNLTYNDHLIHLDPQYAREVEGHERGVLVHGPLTMVLMLTALDQHLQQTQPGGPLTSGEEVLPVKRGIAEFHYRNMAPLYADEELRVCGSPHKNSQGAQWHVWIEGPEGGLAVKGDAVIYHMAL
ncbi:hypothetical protein QBC35DRAFT_461112 [Podospora australis]|uniref:MaoC-like domain-containing protein n=1 Tax=Podospora australis TaxID=1536484 RepID=A0AAN6WZA1_9PEZI|nr:hypothetical protein QBC35DRAFT_461112 [Podospora australis]